MQAAATAEPGKSQLTTDSVPRPDSSPIRGPDEAGDDSQKTSSSVIFLGELPTPASHQLGIPAHTTENKNTYDSSWPPTLAKESSNLGTVLATSVASNDSAPTSPKLRRDKRTFDEVTEIQGQEEVEDSQVTDESFTSALSDRHSLTRREAYYNMLEGADGGWAAIALISTNDGHTAAEREL